jgi:hypothetical protein
MTQDLMRGGADLMSLAMLATRAQAAARRASQSAAASADDSQALTALSKKLDAVAQSIQFFDTRGQAGSAPSGAVAAQVEVTLETVAHAQTGATDRQRIAEELGRLADMARRVPHEPTDASDLVRFCTGLADSVLKQTRHVGEVTAAL